MRAFYEIVQKFLNKIKIIIHKSVINTCINFTSKNDILLDKYKSSKFLLDFLTGTGGIIIPGHNLTN
jgi:hypothetical protein